MQKPLTFRPLPFILLLLALSFTACRFNPDTQKPGENYLQGEWQQDTSALRKKLVTSSLYNLRFSCDSFYMSIKWDTKVNGGVADSCTNNGRWAEYAKGVYDQKNDTLHVRGLFCNANFTYKDPTGCFRSGVYEEYFKMIKKTDSALQFNSTSSVITINTHLIKRTTCTPKPL